MVKLIIAFLAGAWIGILTMCILSMSKETAKNSGVWITRVPRHYECSECGWRSLLKCPYCPNCGTKMEGEPDNDKL